MAPEASHRKPISKYCPYKNFYLLSKKQKGSQCYYISRQKLC